MGTLFSTIQRPIEAAAESVTEIIRRRGKRKREDDCFDYDNEDGKALELSMATPKKKKLETTAQYIYQALYKEETNYDITVMALGKMWHLHKVYLSQSPYFASMFGGSWRESTQKFIKIQIIDSNITIESLSLVFGSLYIDEVEIDPKLVVSILATAALFQLDGLSKRCTEVMIELTNAETVVDYYEASCKYGNDSIKKVTFNWLLINLMNVYAKNLKWLRTIGIDLMHDLLSSPDLYVIPTEFALYILLKFWMFIQLNPLFECIEKNVIKDEPTNFFNKREGQEAFLETREGKPFEKVFRTLRIHHLLNHHVDLTMIIEDRIVPRSWLSTPLFHQWNSMLKIDQSIEAGPKECDEATFYKHCLRCGRTLQEEGFQKWRWNGFNFGLDLVLKTDTRILTIKRHHRTEHERLLSMQVNRKFLIRVTIASLNDLKQLKHSQTTGIKSISLDKNEERQLLVMEKELVYPLILSVNLLLVTPEKEIETIESNNLLLVENLQVTNYSNEDGTCSRYLNNNNSKIHLDSNNLK